MSESPSSHSGSEKERVYEELGRTRRKNSALKREVDHLRKATDAKENAALRREAGEYRKALSNIAHRLDNGGVEEDTLRNIVQSALLLRGLKAFQREQIKKVHGDG